MKRMFLLASVFAILATVANADPCGMVPPISLNGAGNITRIGLQNTYVYFKDGVETFVIRPGFEGNVEEFGMLIPFPEPPALRKVSDEIFPQLEKSIDPPEVIVYAQETFFKNGAMGGGRFAGDAKKKDSSLAVNEVRVVREEAVGMYEVAVLEAGSAAALKRWMDDHQYRFPQGMEATCEEYITDKWCFVAVKTRVGPKKNIDPQPGMRQTNPGLPAGASFDGHVQAMGFRFHSDQLVVPMRLSSFNAGELRNVVYILTDGPRKIRAIPEEYVVRQLTGEELYRNVTEPLPVRVIGGTLADIPDYRKQSLPQERDPAPHNGLARELFASDLLTSRTGSLSHSHEEAEKMLLRIGESLNLRGGEIDAANHAALEKLRTTNLATALDDLKKMTLTVVDGDFPREVLGSRNLSFSEYSMPTRRNNATSYSATQHAPARNAEGKLYRDADLGAIIRAEERLARESQGGTSGSLFGGISLGLLLLGLAVSLRARKPRGRS